MSSIQIRAVSIFHVVGVFRTLPKKHPHSMGKWTPDSTFDDTGKFVVFGQTIRNDGGVKFGIMLTEMHGTQEETQAAIAWLQEHHVKVEVLGYV